MDRKWWTLIAVCVGTFMLLLDVTIVNVALPSIQSSLSASFSDLQWVIDAYSLMLAALLLTSGSLADLWGRRRIFVIGLVLFSASSLASGLAQSPLWLNLARGAQGLGGSAMFSTSLALLGSSFQGRERGVAFGVWGAITGLAVAIGPVIGGALTTGLSWRWIFLVNVPIGAAAVVISILRVDESKTARAQRPDPIGVVTFSGALAALVYALIKGDTKGWSSPLILGCLIGAGALLIAFLIAEHLQGERAMFDLNLFRKPTFSGGLVAAFALSGGLFALFLYLTLYLQDILRYSALETGLRFLVLSGGILLTSTLAGRLTARVPIRLLITPGLVLVGVGLLLMRGITADSGWTHLIPGFILTGAGTGLINPPLASTAIGVVKPDRAGMASGINSTFRQIGIATGIAGLGAIFTHEVRTQIEQMLAHAPQVNSSQAHALATSVAAGGGAKQGLKALPPAAQGSAIHALRAGFAFGLNEVFLVGAILTLIAAVLTLVLIRSKDFEVGSARVVTATGVAGPSPGSGTAAEPTRGAATAPAPVSDQPEPVEGSAPASVSDQPTSTPDSENTSAPASVSEHVIPENGSHPQTEVETDVARAADGAGVGQGVRTPVGVAALTSGAGPGIAIIRSRAPSDGHAPPLVPPPPPPPSLAAHVPGLGGAPDRQPPPASGAAQPASGAGAPASSAAEPTAGAGQPASSATEPTSGAGQPASGATEPTSGASQPASGATQSPPGDGDAALAGSQPTYGTFPPDDPRRPQDPDAAIRPDRQDMPVAPDAPRGAPNTHDVRLVAAAVQSAEEAALVYAREIGEARRHLAAAIEHLDQAEEARTLLNRHAGGLMPAEDDARRTSAPISTPSPGIAVAETGQPTAAPPAPPPPRPGGWGSGAAGSR